MTLQEQERFNHVLELQHQIDNGVYKVAAPQIADEIVQIITRDDDNGFEIDFDRLDELSVEYEEIVFRGVYPSEETASGVNYRARITFKGKLINIGNFDTPEEAAHAYDAKAIELLGDSAVLNFPGSDL